MTYRLWTDQCTITRRHAFFSVFGQKGESLGWRKVPKAFASGRATMVSGNAPDPAETLGWRLH